MNIHHFSYFASLSTYFVESFKVKPALTSLEKRIVAFALVILSGFAISYVLYECLKNKFKAAKQEKEKLTALTTEANNLFKQSEWTKAEKKYREILRIDSENPGALLPLADILRRQKGDFKEAERIYKEIIPTASDNAFVHVGARFTNVRLGAQEELIKVLIEQGKFEEAEQTCDRFLKSYQNSPLALLPFLRQRVEILSKQEKHEAAKAAKVELEAAEQRVEELVTKLAERLAEIKNSSLPEKG